MFGMTLPLITMSQGICTVSCLKLVPISLQTLPDVEAFDVDVNSDCLCGRCVQCNAWDWQLVGREEVKDNPQARSSLQRSFAFTTVKLFMKFIEFHHISGVFRGQCDDV